MPSAQPQGKKLSVEAVIEIPAVVITFVMMIHITANAVSRTWFDHPIDQTLEVVQYWYVPLVAFLGFIAAQMRGQHIAADLLYEQLPTRSKRFVLAVMFLVTAVVCLGFARYGWTEAQHAHEIRKTAGVSDLPAWPTYYLVPLAFGSLTLQFGWAAIQAIRHPERDHFVSDPDDGAVLDELAAHQSELAARTTAPQEANR